MTPRHLVLGGALAATLAATAWVATRPDENAGTVAVVEPVRKPTAAASAPAPQTAARQPWAEASAEQLAAWQPPPPPPAPPPPPLSTVAAPAPPSAPPLPYQMIGRLVEGEGAQAVELALLTSPSRTLSVKRGDVIDGQWRVEQVSTSGVSLTWLPSQIPQNIVFKAVP
ncbi:hypothetical protein [Roseateles asaccharophilus]|uniref:General secretion pathway protein GspN n=1 Tax=Roseateles asaccharophilus TaxID=582607 RepID=A0ABU2ADA9_9BURK|nr:hypothetical protein [Roseateles asaccharophilus]MDR7335196.1 hypothetical protein [Roseateles asaccharophilus]